MKLNNADIACYQEKLFNKVEKELKDKVSKILTKEICTEAEEYKALTTKLNQGLSDYVCMIVYSRLSELIGNDSINIDILKNVSYAKFNLTSVLAESLILNKINIFNNTEIDKFILSQLVLISEIVKVSSEEVDNLQN